MPASGLLRWVDEKPPMLSCLVTVSVYPDHTGGFSTVSQFPRVPLWAQFSPHQQMEFVADKSGQVAPLSKHLRWLPPHSSPIGGPVHGLQAARGIPRALPDLVPAMLSLALPTSLQLPTQLPGHAPWTPCVYVSVNV